MKKSILLFSIFIILFSSLTLAWDNTSFQYRQSINISNYGSETLRMYHTIEVSGFDTTDSNKFNLSMDTNFAVYCNGVEVDKLIGNETDLMKDPLTQMYDSNSGWATANTTFLFRLPENITASTDNDTMCYTYYGNKTFNSTYNNISNIALMYDDFKRANGNLGNGWVDNGVNIMQISSNWAIDDSNNDMAGREIDIGVCYDCEKYEMNWRYFWGGTNGGGGCFGFANMYDLDTNGLCNYIAQTVPKGIVSTFSDESNSWRITNMSEGTTLISDGGKWDDVVQNIVAFDDINKGYYLVTINNTEMTVGLDTNITNAPNQDINKSYVTIGSNRANNKIDYIFIKRYVDIAPIISLGDEEAFNTAPTQPILYSPANGTLGSNNWTFVWLNSTDAENDDINYSIQISNFSDFSVIEFEGYDILEEGNGGDNNQSNYTFPLLIEGEYFWRVWASDMNTSGSLNSSYADTFEFTWDITGAEVEIYAPNSSYASNSYNNSLDVNSTDKIHLDSCWYHINFTSNGSLEGNEYNFVNCNVTTTFNVTQDGNYTIEYLANDTSNNVNMDIEQFISDENPPYEVSGLPSGNLGSQTVPLDPLTNDTVDTILCWYNLTLGGATIIADTITACNTATTFNTLSDGTFTVSYGVNDSASNMNSSSSTIIVSTSGGVVGGGGGGATTPSIKASENRSFELSTVLYNQKLKDIEFYAGSGLEIEEKLFLWNTGTTTKTITVECKESTDNMCENVKLLQSEFEILPSLTTVTEVKYNIDIPDKYQNGDIILLTFVATDENGLQDVNTVTIKISNTLSRIKYFLFSFLKVKDYNLFGIPLSIINLIPFLVLEFLFGILSGKFIPKSFKFKPLIIVIGIFIIFIGFGIFVYSP